MSNRVKEGIQFAVLLHDVSRLRRVVADRALKTIGTTWTQWSVLAFLSRGDGLTQIALAAELELTRVAIGDVLGRMEAAGLVERRSDAADARIRRVYLTRNGRRMLNRSYKDIEHFPALTMRPVSDEDLAGALRVLAQIKGILMDTMEEERGGAESNQTYAIHGKSAGILALRRSAHGLR